MAKKSKKNNHYDFSGIPIRELITTPLLAIVQAQSKMAKEQVRDLLKNCFYYNGNYYEPILIKMSVTRATLEASNSPDKGPKLEQITTFFNLPLIAIFPFSSLGIESVQIDFELEVTSQYALDADWSEVDEEQPKGGSGDFINKKTSKVEMLGRVATKANSTKNINESESISTAYTIDVVAGPIPLTNGLLDIINIYSKAIEPMEMPEIENKTT